MSWRLAYCLGTLRNEIDAKWPNRSKVSDGSIGDPAHSSRDSDHNPSPAGVVRAIDITVVGIDADWLTEHLRRLGEYGDQRLVDGGYIIFNGRICSDIGDWAWRTYQGSNPHTKHIHVSCTRTAHFDSLAAWQVSTPPNVEDDMTPAQEQLLRDVLAVVRAEQEWRRAHLDPRTSNIEKAIYNTALPALSRIESKVEGP